MLLETGPIIRSTLRNKAGAILIALQIAVTMTIIVNAVSMVNERDKLVNRESGLDEENLFYLTSMGFAQDFNEKVTVKEDLRQIRSMPGVVNAVQINTIPLLGGGWSGKLQLTPGEDVDRMTGAIYLVDPQGIDTMGIELIGGRNFTENDMQYITRGDWPDSFIISKALAETLFDGDWQKAIGKTVFIRKNEPVTIIGVVKKLQGPWATAGNIEMSILSPNYMAIGSSRYLIRTEPGKRDTLMLRVENMLALRDKGRLIREMDTLSANRERSYRRDNSVKTILNFVTVVLVIITALGIVGLASFSVNRRRRQIGVRRALGASKQNIIFYFLQENFYITCVGIALGAVGSIALNIWLVDTFAIGSLQWYYIPVGMVAMSLLGLFAVYLPAKKAADISPATATRSV